MRRATPPASPCRSRAIKPTVPHSTVLLNVIKTSGGGRTYAGLPGNWGAQYEIGQVPVYEYLADTSVDEVGFLLRTPSLVADNEAYFNQSDPAQYQLYNVRYILMPQGMQPPVPATLIASSGRHQLWLVATSGYLQVVDTSGIVEANRADMATQMQPFLQSASFEHGDLATVAFNGGTAATPTLPISAAPTTPAGTSIDTVVDGQDGRYAGTLTANRTAAVVLKATFDPGWHVTVDGKAATPYMVVPGFVAVTVTPGHHSVVFQYVAYSHYALLLGIGVLTLLGTRIDARGCGAGSAHLASSVEVSSRFEGNALPEPACNDDVPIKPRRRHERRSRGHPRVQRRVECGIRRHRGSTRRLRRARRR